MSFKVRVKPPNEREATIRAAAAASNEYRDFYDFRSQKMRLPLVRLAEDLLLYRMENFRTYIDQRSYIIREKKPANFLSDWTGK